MLHAAWSLQGAAVERRLQVPRLSAWNFYRAPEQTEDVPHPWTLLAACFPWPSSALAELEQSWGYSHLCWPKHPPAPAHLEQGPGHTLPTQLWLPTSSWWLWCLYGAPTPPGNPCKTHCISLLVSPCCLRWEKQLQGREGLSPNIPCYIHGTAAHQKAPSKKGRQLHDGKAGLTALGHSACPLPSPQQRPAQPQPHLTHCEYIQTWEKV